jgi:hypothetical protein
MKYLYKYPQAAYPYVDLIDTNRRRNRGDMEYELLDTGVFNEDRYFDVFVEFAKQSPEDILVQISVSNRGPESATVHVLPTLWFRNTWTWWPGTPKPSLRQVGSRKDAQAIAASHADLGERYLYCEGDFELLFTENETNNERIFGTANQSPYVKDGINKYVVEGKKSAVNSEKTGTKSAAHYQLNVGAGQTATIRLRLTDAAPTAIGNPFKGFAEILQTRHREADEFYKSITPERVSADEALVMRQALAGMLWTKQYFFFDVDLWLTEHGQGHAHMHGWGTRRGSPATAATPRSWIKLWRSGPRVTEIRRSRTTPLWLTPSSEGKPKHTSRRRMKASSVSAA